MRQAIQVTKSDRGLSHAGKYYMVAKAQAGSIRVDWDHVLSPEENYIAAAKALAVKFNWTNDWSGGVLEDGSYVFVDLGGFGDFSIV